MCLRPCNMKPLLDCEAEGTAGTMPAWVASFSAPAQCGVGSFLQGKKLSKKTLCWSKSRILQIRATEMPTLGWCFIRPSDQKPVPLRGNGTAVESCAGNRAMKPQSTAPPYGAAPRPSKRGAGRCVGVGITASLSGVFDRAGGGMGRAEWRGLSIFLRPCPVGATC